MLKPNTRFIKKNRTILLSFLLPFVFILLTITLSSLMVNLLKDIQNDSITAIYHWEKLHSYASDRYNLNRKSSTDEFNKRIEFFDSSIYSLQNTLPSWIFWVDLAEQTTVSIRLWEHIKQTLIANEATYKNLMATDLGQHLQGTNISQIVASEFTQQGKLKDFDPYSFFLFSKMEADYEILLDYINAEAFFEKRLLSLNESLGRSVNILINLILIMAVVISIFVMISVFRNIKNRFLEQQRNEENLSQILNSVGEGMIVLSPEQSILKMNPVAKKILALDESGFNSEDLFSRIFGKAAQGTPFHKALSATEPHVFLEDMTIELRNDDNLHISSSTSPVFDADNNVSGVVFVFQDITQRKQQERALLNHKETLESLVESRTQKLQQSLDDLKKTQAQLIESEKMSSLGSLVAGVSHEINTPIGISVTAASILLKDATELKNLLLTNTLAKSKLETFTDNSIETATMLLSNLQRAARLIQSFKLVAVDQSSEEMREFLLGNYIDEIILSTSSKFKNTGHSIDASYAQDITVKSYPGAIAQIMTNLLINSLTHGFENIENGVVSIAFSKREHDVNIHYQDSGVGISDDNIKKVFDPFFTTKRGVGGSGLGMNIVYNLVTQTLKGEITCTSKLGQGTQFDIRFPHNMD